MYKIFCSTLNIHLEAFTRDDFTRFISWITTGEELIQFAGPAFSFPLTESQLENYIDNKLSLPFKVINTLSGEVIGHGEIYLGDAIPRLCRILVANPAFRGKGIGKQIVTALLEKAFAITDAKQVDLNVYDWNTGAIKCYESLGFKRNPGKEKEITVGGKQWISVNLLYEGVKGIEPK